jgi:plasmid maintenance system killer protein
MNVAFVSHRLAELLQSPKALAREYGPENAKTIGLRLNSLYAADNLQVLSTLPGRLEELKGDRAGTFSLRLKHGLRLVFAPQDLDSARRPDGALEWVKVRAVIVLEVVNYHD